jgi:hypothetical protein
MMDSDDAKPPYDPGEPLFDSLEECAAAFGWGDEQIEKVRRDMLMTEPRNDGEPLH